MEARKVIPGLATLVLFMLIPSTSIQAALPDGTKLTHIPVTHIPTRHKMAIIPITHQCPESCLCHQNPRMRLLVINCEGRNLTELPETLPRLKDLKDDYWDEYAYDLNFIDNHIDGMCGRNYIDTYYAQTKILRLSRNNMEMTLSSVFALMNRLEVLYLDHNKINYMAGVISIDSKLSMLREVRLQGNVWRCDCNWKESLRWMKLKEHIIKDKTGIVCSIPQRMSGKKVFLLTEDDLWCESDVIAEREMAYKYILTFFVTLIFWSVVAACGYYISYKYRMRLFSLFHWHFYNYDECNGESKEFDLFLAYAEVNKEYAIDELLEWLENEDYRVSQRHVNYMGGMRFADNIDYCVHTSKRTVAVLSKAFTQSKWCQTEFFTALDIDKEFKTERLIGILIEDLDEENCDERFVNFTKEARCLRRGDPDLHQKLAYMLANTKMGKQKPRRSRFVRPDQIIKAVDVTDIILANYARELKRLAEEEKAEQERQNGKTNEDDFEIDPTDPDMIDYAFQASMEVGYTNGSDDVTGCPRLETVD